MVRRRRQSSSQPMYGWALAPNGRPVPIAMAERGAHGYVCPICDGPMIAKKGNINQHHYAHENISNCTPEDVAHAIAGKWLVLSLGTLMVLGEPAYVSWTVNSDTFSANILLDVTSIVENMQTDLGRADITLLRRDGSIRCIIVLDIDRTMDSNTLARFTGYGIPVVILPADAFRSGNINLGSLLDMAEVQGGWWLLGQPDDLPDLELNPDVIRQALGEAVTYPPYRFWGPLTKMGMRENILRVNNYLLWLPENMWQLAVGGAHHKLSDDLDIVIQEWSQPDGGAIALYYVDLKGNKAVAVRRFLPGEHVHASLSAGFWTRRTKAEEIAYHLAMD